MRNKNLVRKSTGKITWAYRRRK